MNGHEESPDEFQRMIDDAYKRAYEKFPKSGAKLLYRGTNQFWVANLIANAERELRIGEIYTRRTIKLASSWACVTLEETGDLEYSLGSFEECVENLPPDPLPL